MAVQTLLRVRGAVVGKRAAVSLPSIPLRTGPFCFGRQAVPCVSALRKPFIATGLLRCVCESKLLKPLACASPVTPATTHQA
jgi:hypothetical protein